jgi:hypothetical protein
MRRLPGRRAAALLLPVAVTVALIGAGLAFWAGPGAASLAQPGSDEKPRMVTTATIAPAPTTPPVTSAAPGTTSAPTSASAPKATAAHSGGAAPGTPVVPAGSRLFTFVNRSGQTIWLAGWQQTATPALSASGWVLPSGGTVDVVVPDKWNGRFWGRTGCSFDAGGRGHCVTGDCGGVFQCRGYGAIPATLAEYNLSAWQGMDFYDVSMVDGSNLPMYLNISSGGTKDPVSPNGCVSAGCTSAVACPAELVVDGGTGCESACGKLGGDQYCCTGQWAARSACDPTQWQPEDFATVFKKAEPYAYSYADDDATSTFTCTGGCDYRITFGLTP